MNRVLIVTRTNWNEPPRIRHQITRLLKAKGYQITYIEKNSYRNLFVKHRREEGIVFFAHAELIHHQLRYFPLIQAANNFVVKFYLRRILKELKFDFIMNFCYEYHFLKDLAPGKKIITMIEDDFESQAKFGMTRAIRNQIRKTCVNSDYVLTVSYPLMEKLKRHTANVRMLFPWSQKKYTRPQRSDNRNTVLYFGYIHRMEWNVVEQLISETSYKFRFVGPPAKRLDIKMIRFLKQTYLNFEYVPFSTLSDLKLDDVFCSILPYDPEIKSVQACTISNRAFNLLSCGLPLAYADLQALLEAPDTVIRKNRTVKEYKECLKFFNENFENVQGDIEAFLNHHYEGDRWKVLETTINSG
jgi:hypothetical protein